MVKVMGWVWVSTRQINPICSSESDIIYGQSLALFFTETIFLKIHLLLKREKLLG